MRSIALLFMVFVLLETHAQSTLDIIEQNNTTLKALRKQAEADKAAAHAATSLDAPEVEFGYLWGSPAPAPGRKDISVSQSFDIATITGRRHRVASNQAELAELDYGIARRRILLEAEQTLVSLTCADTILALQQRRLHDAQSLSEAWHKRLDEGEAVATDVNKIDLALKLLEGEVMKAGLERQECAAQLARLNGGMPLVPAYDYGATLQLPLSFDGWYAQMEATSPAMQYAIAETRLADSQLRLAKSENLPKVAVGYVGELVKGDNYQGVKVGLEIPLWGGKQRTKAARAASEAAEARRVDAALQMHSTMRQLYDRAATLQRIADAYISSACQYDNTSLMKKALEAGSLSVTDYLAETSMQYETQIRATEALRDYRLALTSLLAADI